jgi:hypothetical protein
VRKSLQGFTEDLANDISPDIAAHVAPSFEKAKPSRAALNNTASATPSGEATAGGTVTITNHPPQAQRAPKTRDDIADGIRLAPSI